MDATLSGHRVVQLLNAQLVRDVVGCTVSILLNRCEADHVRLRLVPVRTILVLVLHRVLLLGLHVHSEASHLLLHLHELVLHHVLRGIELILLLVLVVLHRLLGLLLLQQHLHVESARVHEHVLATEGTHAARLHHHLAADVVAAELTVRRTAVHVGHVTAKLTGSSHLPRLLHLLVHVRHAV